MDGMLRTVAYGKRRCTAENQHLNLRFFERLAIGGAGARDGRSPPPRAAGRRRRGIFREAAVDEATGAW